MQTTKSRPGLSHYVEGILKGDRVVLAQAITLVESTLSSDQDLASELLEQIVSKSGNSIRIGITGSPGVGKSTFIESFGKYITDLDKRIAVLTVDPSSQRTKGSILGDKTRMHALSRNHNAFIRPSASGSALGGVAYKTREVMLLCEAAGFDVILVETVGVGQSEVAVKNMVDFFLLLMLPGSGDELQGIKKGIMEMADALVITKADGENIPLANAARIEFEHALHLFRAGSSDWKPKVLTASAFTEMGIKETWDLITEHKQNTSLTHSFQNNRKAQNVMWFEEHFKYLLQQELETSSSLQQQANALKEKVSNQTLPPTLAAKQLLTIFLESLQTKK